MEKKTEIKKNSNGSITTIKTIETTPEDGFVPEGLLRPTSVDTVGKYHKGYAKTKSFSTNDPRITRPFVYGTCSLILILGIVMLLTGNLFFGIVFTISGILVLNKAKKDIDKVAEELKAKGHDVTIDSVEEKEQIKEEFVGAIKENVKDVTSSVFTEDRYNWFVKTTVPIYCVIVAIIVILISVFVNIFLGLFLLIILSLGGLLYYFLISKICKVKKR